MQHHKFEEQTKDLKLGDIVKISVRGNYGFYSETGAFVKIESGRIYLETGLAHSWKRIFKVEKLFCAQTEKGAIAPSYKESPQK